MAIIKTIDIDGKPVPFKASAAIPRLYRYMFGRDIFKDLKDLSDAVEASKADGSALGIPSLEIFENVAYLMARYADPTIPPNPDEWLDAFETFSIYRILPQLLELWGMNLESHAESKKKFAALTAK